MSRFVPYLGSLLAIAVGILVVALSNTVTVINNPKEVAVTASSSISMLPNIIFPSAPLDIELPTLNTAIASTSATTSQVNVATSTTEKLRVEVAVKTPVKVVKTKTVATIKPVVVSPVAPVVSSGSSSLDSAATDVRAALVNIVCNTPIGGRLNSISGSGIFIDSKGIILTNAHVAQYFLLADRGAKCLIRDGSPAVNKYEAALIYISPSWIRANPSTLTETLPTGTGEYDFALLAVTKGIGTNTVQSSFPFVPLTQSEPYTGMPVVIASYGAQFLESSQIQSALFPTIVFGSVKDIYTFDINTIDVLALGGSAAAQEGSSGGGVVDSIGSLIGTITTSTVQGPTETRFLNAISTYHVRSTYAREMGSSLSALLAQPTSISIEEFIPQMPKLEEIITVHLQ